MTHDESQSSSPESNSAGRGTVVLKPEPRVRKALPNGWSTFDKRSLGAVAKIALTSFAFVGAGAILEPANVPWTAFVAVVGFRIALSLVFFGEYRLSWTRASSKTGFLELGLGALALGIYLPILASLGLASIKFLLLEAVVFQYLQNLAIFGYRHLYCYGTPACGTVVVYGAQSRGARLAQEFQQSGYKVVCFIEDSRHQRRMVVDGIPILSIKQAIRKLRGERKIDLLVFAMEASTPEGVDRRWKRLSEFVSACKILPPIDEHLKERSYLNLLKEVTVEDLLARKPKDLDRGRIASFLKGRSVLITGAGGSIGSELARQCQQYGVRELLLLDHSEYNLYQIAEELPNAVPLLVSVTDRESLGKVFEEYRPEIVIHAAAYKHVPMVERNPVAGVRNNVSGTKNAVDMAIRYGARNFVLISTDKAVRPTNVMGASKRVCELYAQNSNGLGTDIVAVRFGNVLGSSGSVIPKFRKLIEDGRDLPVTHPDITRYFMLIPEACGLVLQAGALGHGGEIFILDMGEPVRISDLARRMLNLSGRTDLGVVYTGLRPGEKLYEELLISDADLKTEYRSIMVARPTIVDRKILDAGVERLLASDDPAEALRLLVPDFEHCRDNKAAA